MAVWFGCSHPIEQCQQRAAEPQSRRCRRSGRHLMPRPMPPCRPVSLKSPGPSSRTSGGCSRRGSLRNPAIVENCGSFSSLSAGLKHLPASEAFFTSAESSVKKVSCCSMSFRVPSRPAGPGMARDHALPAERQRPLERRFPLDRVGIVDGEARWHRAERIEVHREDDLLLRQEHHQRGSSEWLRPGKVQLQRRCRRA